MTPTEYIYAWHKATGDNIAVTYKPGTLNTAIEINTRMRILGDNFDHACERTFLHLLEALPARIATLTKQLEQARQIAADQGISTPEPS